MVIRIVSPRIGGAAGKTLEKRRISQPPKNFPSLARSVQMLFVRQADARKSRSPTPARSPAQGSLRAAPPGPEGRCKDPLFMAKAVGRTSEGVRLRHR
jgi:hypothetical protein